MALRVTVLAATALAAAVLGATGVARAEGRPAVLVELFTSQGCSSCPPADAMFRDLAAMEGVIALSLHVDYWDYIGWVDSFAQPAFTDRQKAYARAAGERMIYTPQIIVDGATRVMGGDAMAVMQAVAVATPADVGLQVAREGTVLRIRAEEIAGRAVPIEVHLVRYSPEETVDILQGENAGHSVTYVNVVTGWTVAGIWPPGGALDLSTEVTGTEPAVVILQEQGPGTVLAAALVP